MNKCNEDFDAVVAEVATQLAEFEFGRVLVAVSGGSDSVGLLRGLALVKTDLRLVLIVAHLNHGVRGADAEADAAFVGELAAQLGFSFELSNWLPARATHFEADARRARLEWLTKVAQRHSACAVALGHTCDDQAETILHRIIRGTGLRGLAGIPRRRRVAEGVLLIRPMLGLGRDQIRAFLQAIGQTWREDATNSDPRQTRARIRHNLLATLRDEYNPRIVDALLRLGDAAREEREVVQAWADGWRLAHTTRPARDVICFDLTALRSLAMPARSEVIRAAWSADGWPEREMSRACWRRVAELVDKAAQPRTQVPGVAASIDGDVLRLERLDSH